MRPLRKGEGFPGQRIVVLPPQIIVQALQQPLLRALLPTDAGLFPQAAGHWRRRDRGVDQAILIYNVKGAGWCELAGRRHEVRAGQLLVVPPNAPHAYGADLRNPWTIAWVHVAGADVGALLHELAVTETDPIVPLGQDAQVLGLFEQVIDTLEHGYTPAHLLYSSQTLLHLIGTMIWRRRSGRNVPDTTQKIQQSIAYMKEHLGQGLRVPQLARLANLSVSHYTAVFKEQTGYAPMEYLMRLRMHQACQLLDTTALPVKEIALRVGYEDQLYFSRVFRQVNDVPPTEYRSLHKG